MNNLMTTWLDVVILIPNYFDFALGKFNNITKGRIIKFIEDAQNFIQTDLRPYYGDSLDINTTRLYSECLLSNKNPDFILDNSGITISNNFTQVYTIKFIQETQGDINSKKFMVLPDAGSSTNGQTDQICTMTNLVLGTSCWNGETFLVGDTIYLAVHHYENLISQLCSKWAAALVLDQTANSQLASDGPNAQNLKSEVNTMLTSIKDPFAELLLIKQKTQDTDAVPVYYDIDKYGNDNTEYLEE